MSRGYPITPKEIEYLCRDLDNDTGNWYGKRDIEKARKAKEELSAKQRKNIEPTQLLEIDTDPEVEKIKRPKVQDASKITNQTQKKEGYGLAGERLKKQSSSRKLKEI